MKISQSDINNLPASLVYGNNLHKKLGNVIKKKKNDNKLSKNAKKQDAIIKSILNHKKKPKQIHSDSISKKFSKNKKVNSNLIKGEKLEQKDLELSKEYFLVNPVSIKDNKTSKNIKNKPSVESKNKLDNSNRKFGINKNINTEKAKVNGKSIQVKDISQENAKAKLSNAKNKDISQENAIAKLSNAKNKDSSQENAKAKLSNAKNLKNEKKKSGIAESIGEDSENNSVKNGLNSFKYVLQDFDINEFFSKYWEQKPLLIKGKSEENPYSSIFSTAILDEILRKKNIIFGKNLDITSYKDGKRETLNQEGRALAPIVWNYYNNGCSVRLLNPQTFHKPVWKLLESLQEYFGSFCGANVYLTPPGTQGFAPHWDDIEAFILQLEGSKHWKVYQPKMANTLPRTSSGNFSDADDLGTKIFDQELKAGDMLYFPRGFIHQGFATDQHSLHITISTYQKTSWIDFMEKMLPLALSAASANNLEFRKGLPVGYLRQLGKKDDDKHVKEFMSKVQSLLRDIITPESIQDGADEMAKSLIHDALPPALTKKENSCTVWGDGERWNEDDMNAENTVEISGKTSIKLIRRGCIRLVEEDDATKLYSSVQNSREYHEVDPLNIELNDDEREAVQSLVDSYPKYVKVKDLPMELSDSMELVAALWENGILRTKEPLSGIS